MFICKLGDSWAPLIEDTRVLTMKWVGFIQIHVVLVSLATAKQIPAAPDHANQLRNKIPLEVLKEMSHIHSTAEFVKKFLSHGGNQGQEAGKEGLEPGITNKTINTNLTKKFEDDVFTGPGSVDDNGANVAEEYISVPGDCQPSAKTVALPRDIMSSIVYWPDCILLDQCGGCCFSDLLECQPVTTFIHNVNAIVMDFNVTTSQFAYLGVSTIGLERHDSCECVCKVQSYHCHPTKQEYLPQSCRCRCINENDASLCTTKQKWDENKCECVCQKEITCPPKEYFHPGSCRCVKETAEEERLQEPNPCPNTGCRARHAAVWSDGECKCVLSDEWGELQNPGSLDINDKVTTTTSRITVRPTRRPRPRRNRFVARRVRSRRDTEETADQQVAP